MIDGVEGGARAGRQAGQVGVWQASAALRAAALASVLAGSLMPGAQAALVVQSLDILAEARVEQTDGNGTHRTQDVRGVSMTCLANLCTGLPGRVEVLASAQPLPAQQVHAAQDVWGAFGHRQDVELRNYGTGVERVGSVSRSAYQIVVGADSWHTPLMLDFRWVASQVAAGSYYGSGTLDAWSRVEIAVSRNGGPEQVVWGFDDRIHKDVASNDGLFSATRADTDVLGIGLPAYTFETTWREFMTWGDARRGAFFGTLDFGVLQPGEAFTLTYRAEAASVMSDVRYLARSELLLNDPFALRDGQPLFALRGLDLRFDDEGPAEPPPGQVPEPGSAALALMAFAAMGAGATTRRRRPSAA